MSSGETDIPFGLLIACKSNTSKVFLKFGVDMGIINTMDNEILSAVTLLEVCCAPN